MSPSMGLVSGPMYSICYMCVKMHRDIRLTSMGVKVSLIRGFVVGGSPKLALHI